MTEYHNEQQGYYEESLKNKHIRSMPEGSARLAALRDLGVTFDEGHHKTTKIATPSGTPKLPTFVDAAQIECILNQKKLNSFSTPLAEDLSQSTDFI